MSNLKILSPNETLAMLGMQKEIEGLSSCCGAEVVAQRYNEGFCSACGGHCGVEDDLVGEKINQEIQDNYADDEDKENSGD